MTSSNGRRLDRLEEAVDDDDAGEALPVMVMADDDLDPADPRLVALVAQAVRERRMVVTPWEETDTGELVDTSSAAYLAAQPAHVIELPRRAPDPPAPSA